MKVNFEVGLKKVKVSEMAVGQVGIFYVDAGQ